MVEPSLVYVDEGGYGVVSILENQFPPIVLKEISATDEGSFEKELRVLKELSHPNIVKYMNQPNGFVYSGQKLVIFMEYCENGSLKSVLKDATIVYSVATVVKFATEIFSALAYLEERRKVHRDIKLANIFLTRLWQIKIGDFGIVKDFERAPYTRSYLGTMGYIAPEILKERTLDEKDLYKCDVYAAGIVLWEVIERRTPAESDFRSVFCEETSDLQKLVNKCREEDFRKRFTAREALEAVEKIPKKIERFGILPEKRIAQKVLLKTIGIDGYHDEYDLFAPKQEFDVPTLSTFSSNSLDKPKLEVKEGEVGRVKEELEGLQNFKLSQETKASEPPGLYNVPTLSTFSLSGGEKEQENAFGEGMLLPIHYEKILDEWTKKLKAQVVWEPILGFNLQVHRDLKSVLRKYPDNANDMNLLEVRKIVTRKLLDRFERLAEMPEAERLHLMESCWDTIKVHEARKNELAAHFNVPLMETYTPGDDEGEEKDADFAELLRIDYKLQNAVVQNACATLWVFDKGNLMNSDLSNLLEIATRTIESIEALFTRRIFAFVIHFGNSKTEWVSIEPYRSIYFSKDFAQCYQVHEKQLEGIYRRGYHLPLDTEAIRRALHDRCVILSQYNSRLHYERFCLDVVLEEMEEDGDESSENQQFRRFYKRDASTAAFVEHFRDADPSNEFSDFYFFFNSPPIHEWATMPYCEQSKRHIDYFASRTLPPKPPPTNEQRAFTEKYRLFERAFSYLLWYANIDKHLTVLHLIEEFLRETEKVEDYSLKCLFVSIDQPVAFRGNYLFVHVPSTNTVVLLDETFVLTRGSVEPVKLSLIGYVNVRFRELRKLLEEMVALYNADYYSACEAFPELCGEWEYEVEHQEERQKLFKSLQTLAEFRATMRARMGEFWKRMDVHLAPTWKELHLVEYSTASVLFISNWIPAKR